VILSAVAALAIAVGIARGDGETIHRFAAQI
jgi:hypothetical protein